MVAILVGHPRQKHKWAFRHRIGQPIRKAGFLHVGKLWAMLHRGVKKETNKHNLATSSASLNTRSWGNQNKKGNTIERRLHGKRFLKAVWCSKTTSTIYSVPKAKRKYKRKGNETHKKYGQRTSKMMGKNRIVPVFAFCLKQRQQKKKAIAGHVLTWRTSPWCARRNIKIMSQENCKNKRKRKSAKVQGRRKEHLSVLGEATTAQHESACFPDAAPPSNERMAAKQQQNERKETKMVLLRQLGCGTCSATTRTCVWPGIGNLKSSYPPAQQYIPKTPERSRQAGTKSPSPDGRAMPMFFNSIDKKAAWVK